MRSIALVLLVASPICLGLFGSVQWYKHEINRIFPQMAEYKAMQAADEAKLKVASAR